MTQQMVLTQLNTLEKKAQALRLHLAWQTKPVRTKKNVWQQTAGIMSWRRGQRVLKAITASRALADQKLQRISKQSHV